ncbi:hypothetical protein J2T09_005398 [Neorhizobium huautlense]|uniref:Uncharacterized protein n=1 Tax=Neorhizobium huautlense TaxID=67774 RepID=A0ABT9Q1L3_9HYPH|nr:hypothetical protein [Neorhizobium huautlense]
MNSFWVKFSEDTTIDQVVAGLKAVPAYNETYKDDTWFFDANWGTTQRDLNNLKGRIETKSGRHSVDDIGT